MADESAIEEVKRNIAGIESGGNYRALGPVTKKGDRAYGKYQVMGDNIANWTREATGVATDADTFLNDDDLQEQVVGHRVGKYLDEHGGNVRDVASLWHSGVPYATAVAEGRRDQLGTTTADYANRVARGGSLDAGAAGPPGGGSASTFDVMGQVDEAAPPPTPRTAVVTGPDGAKARVSIPPGASDADIQASIKAVTDHMAAKAPLTTQPGAQLQPGKTIEMGTSGPPPEAPPPGEPLPPPAAPMGTAATTTTPTKGNEAQPKTAAEMTPSDLNEMTPQQAEITLPWAQAVEGVKDAFKAFTGDPRDLSMGDALHHALAVLRPIGLVGESVQNVVTRAAEETPSIGPGYIASGLGFAAGLLVNLGVPIPGVDVPPGPARPLQGTTQTRAEAEAAAAAARDAEDVLATARTTGATATTTAESTATQLDDAALQARAAADDAQRVADEAAGRVTPSPDLRARAATELTPAGTTPTAGSRATTQALGQELREVTEPVKGIYDAVVANADTAEKALGPDEGEMLLGQLDALRKHFGNVYAAGAEAAEGAARESGTLPAASREVFDRLETAITSGERVSARLVDDFKQQLDTLFPGRVPHGATPMERSLYDFKWQTRDALRTMFDGDEKLWAEAADALYRDEIIGKGIDTALGPLTRLAQKSPATFVERVFGSGASDKNAMYATALMKKLPEAARQALREATLARAIGRATDTATGALDPRRLLTAIGNYSPEFYNAVVGRGQDTFIKALRAEQAAVGETAGVAGRGAQWATTAEREAGAAGRQAARVGNQTAAEIAAAERGATMAQGAAQRAAEVAARPNRLAYIGAAGVDFLLHKAGVTGAIGAPLELLGFGISARHLATYLADSTMANLLARAIRTTATSPAAVTVMEEIRKRADALGLPVEDRRAQPGGAP